MSDHITHIDSEVWTEDPRFPNLSLQLLVSQTHNTEISMIRVLIQGEAGISSHTHLLETEIVYILEGQAILVMQDKEYSLSAGSVAVIPPKTEHSLHNPTTETIEILAIHSPPTR